RGMARHAKEVGARARARKSNGARQTNGKAGCWFGRASPAFIATASFLLKERSKSKFNDKSSYANCLHSLRKQAAHRAVWHFSARLRARHARDEVRTSPLDERERQPRRVVDSMPLQQLLRALRV